MYEINKPEKSLPFLSPPKMEPRLQSLAFALDLLAQHNLRIKNTAISPAELHLNIGALIGGNTLIVPLLLENNDRLAHWKLAVIGPSKREMLNVSAIFLADGTTPHILSYLTCLIFYPAHASPLLADSFRQMQAQDWLEPLLADAPSQDPKHIEGFTTSVDFIRTLGAVNELSTVTGISRPALRDLILKPTQHWRFTEKAADSIPSIAGLPSQGEIIDGDYQIIGS